MRVDRSGRLLVLLALMVLAGCPDAPEARVAQLPGSRSPDARPEQVATLLRKRDRSPGPGDGGGRAWLAGAPETRRRVTAGETDRFTIVYEAGPAGIAVGGALELLVPPFLGWSVPQLSERAQPGFVRASTPAAGVRLRARLLGPMLVRFEVQGRALAAGERIEVAYGETSVDSSAERDSRFWLFVDGDGDGSSSFLPDSPAVDVAPGAAQRLHLVLPAAARPGESVDLHLSLLDANGNAGIPIETSIRLEGVSPLLEGPDRLVLAAQDRGSLRVSFRARGEGRVRLVASAGAVTGRSNPLTIRAAAPHLLWGDLHGHSNLSDGTGTPEDFYRYARDVAGLDVAALTDHDEHGAPPTLARHPEVWERIRAVVRAFDAPGRFVALLGFEWTSWLQGHRHVLYFDDAGEVFSALDPETASPPGLWDALRGRPALTIGHHIAGGPISLNWDFAPDPDLERVVEIVSGHGSGESADSPHPMRRAFAGHFARDALRRGYRLGFLGSSDSHDGHPGCVQPSPAQPCGLAAILSEERSREGVLAALRARRVYATSGPRILLGATLDDAPMGAVLSARDAARLQVTVVGTAPLERVDLIRSGSTHESLPGRDREELSFERELRDLRAGESLYVRVLQRDGGAAWSSPFFVE